MAALGTARHIIEACLNHQSGVIRGVAAIYNRCRYEPESWLGKFQQSDKWSFCLTAARMAADQERDDDETSAPEPQPGIQGESGSGRHQGREDVGRVGAAFDVHANQIAQWKAQLLGGAAGIFGSETKAGAAAPTVDLKSLHAKIGELTLENDFLEGALSKVGMLSAKR